MTILLTTLHAKDVAAATKMSAVLGELKATTPHERENKESRIADHGAFPDPLNPAPALKVCQLVLDGASTPMWPSRRSRKSQLLPANARKVQNAPGN